jgi:hypothetical protein
MLVSSNSRAIQAHDYPSVKFDTIAPHWCRTGPGFQQKRRKQIQWRSKMVHGSVPADNM